MKSETDLQLLVDAWRKAGSELHKHVSKQLRLEAIAHLRSDRTLPAPLAAWLAEALENKDPALFAEPWKKLLPHDNPHRRMEMAIMARIYKNRPDLRKQSGERPEGFLDLAADMFEVPVHAVEAAYKDHREMLEFLEERMGMKHLPNKGDILAYRDRELERVAEALEDTLRDKAQLLDRLAECLANPEDRA